MKIVLHSIRVSELVEGFEDKNEEGVRGYGGRLNIRPPYQREFIYDDKKRNEVVQTVRKNFPLNTMYWVKAGHCCPVRSRIESVGCRHRVDCSRSPMLEAPVIWAFSRKA
jgi:hypothetical protein